jgi:hypothetical protein
MRASEDSAAQSKILKDALVGKLERILTTLAERQIEAHGAGMRKFGDDISKEITGVLSGPLDALTVSARRNSEGNSEAVTRLLTDVLAGFSQRMEDLFGGQVADINKLQQQTIDSLGTAVGRLNHMVSTVEDAGTKSAEALNERLLSALNDMEAHEKAANERMAALMEQMRSTVDQTQSETNRKLRETLSQLGAAVDSQVAALREQGSAWPPRKWNARALRPLGPTNYFGTSAAGWTRCLARCRRGQIARRRRGRIGTDGPPRPRMRASPNSPRPSRRK